MHEFTKQLKTKASELGFVLSGVAPAAAPGRIEHFNRWLDAGYAGQMEYLERRRQAYSHPRYLLDGCRSIVMLARPYASSPDSPDLNARLGKIARYARGSIDYHDIIHHRLRALQAWLLDHYPDAAVRGVVDTAPLLEREFAEAAGLGWVGKNTLLLNRQWGSYFFLAALVTSLSLTSDEPNEKGYCGSCTACLDACPTAAFPQAYVLDASQCISYLTIEHRGPIADPLRDKLAGWVFGCDVCQEVCPWNRKPHEHDPAFEPVVSTLDVASTLRMSESEFREAFRHTPLWRSRRRGLLRNAILLAGTHRLEHAAEPLSKLLTDDEPLLRAAAAWALARIKPAGWQALIAQAATSEQDAGVRAELRGLQAAED